MSVEQRFLKSSRGKKIFAKENCRKHEGMEKRKMGIRNTTIFSSYIEKEEKKF